jgi:hypothetical protein
MVQLIEGQEVENELQRYVLYVSGMLPGVRFR